MKNVRQPIDDWFDDIERKLLCLEERLIAARHSTGSWGLLGQVRTMLVACQTLRQLQPQPNSRSMANLIVDTYSAERLAGIAPECDQHPGRRAVDSWEGLRICEECQRVLARLQAITPAPSGTGVNR
jgi:hypothetical protein